jgi:methionyl aminopeptidase
MGLAGTCTRIRNCRTMALAIEPMINLGSPEVKVLEDGWTAITVDGSMSAHFEHTVAITNDGPMILTL